MPLPILPALIAGAAYLIYSGFREEGPVATPKRGPGRPKGTKAKAKVKTNVPRETSKPKANVPRETSSKTGATSKTEASPKTKTKPAPKPEPKPEPEPEPKPEPKPEPRRGGTMPKDAPDVPRETSDADS